MSPPDGDMRRGRNNMKVRREAAHNAACLTLLQIAGVDLVSPQGKILLGSRTGTWLKRNIFQLILCEAGPNIYTSRIDKMV